MFFFHFISLVIITFMLPFAVKHIFENPNVEQQKKKLQDLFKQLKHFQPGFSTSCFNFIFPNIYFDRYYVSNYPHNSIQFKPTSNSNMIDLQPIIQHPKLTKQQSDKAFLENIGLKYLSPKINLLHTEINTNPTKICDCEYCLQELFVLDYCKIPKDFLQNFNPYIIIKKKGHNNEEINDQCKEEIKEENEEIVDFETDEPKQKEGNEQFLKSYSKSYNNIKNMQLKIDLENEHEDIKLIKVEKGIAYFEYVKQNENIMSKVELERTKVFTFPKVFKEINLKTTICKCNKCFTLLNLVKYQQDIYKSESKNANSWRWF